MDLNEMGFNNAKWVELPKDVVPQREYILAMLNLRVLMADHVYSSGTAIFTPRKKFSAHFPVHFLQLI